ncbi:MAG: sigma-70 family RNA polymerase sigma factor [Isosphaeraceae bacterium]
MGLRHRRGGLLQDVQTLFDTGTTGGLTDGELLGWVADRAGRGEAAGPAFAALVDRHGPMVLRVCRSILRDEHDAEDAFQATFLVLVRRAGSVRRQESVGSWLHGVALRVAAHARASMARRRRHERCAGTLAVAAARSGQEGTLRERAAVLHEELGRLPERYRAAIVLCYLEGHTCEAAAHRLGWPVGTVKSRLARGRQRLRGRLLRRGLAPDEVSDRVEEVGVGGLVVCSASNGSAPARGSAVGEQPQGGSLHILSGSPPTPVIPAAVAHTTVQAMLRFAAGRPMAGAVSATALSWALLTLRTMQITRLAMISALLLGGIAAAGAAILGAQEREPAQTKAAAPAKASKSRREAAKPDATASVERRSVRVIDTRGRGVPDVEIKVVEEDSTPTDDGPGYRTGTYRTDAHGRVRVAVDRRFNRLTFEARPDAQTIGWARLQASRELSKATDANPVTITLLPRNHRVEGTVVDTHGKPIRGVQVRAVQFNHAANGFATDYPDGDKPPSLASAVTDLAGRYQLSVPQDTIVHFAACHAWFVGPMFSCRPDGQTIRPVTLEDAGGIAGTVVDAATGQPVAGARVGAQCIEHSDRILGGNWGSAISAAQGHFTVGGLAPGVYNLLFQWSPKGRKFTARAVEGVRVKAGAEARADLRLIAGRRLHGTAVDAGTGEPLAGVNILCYNASHPRSGAACQGTYTDEQGRFEYFVPPGPAFVYINASDNAVARNVPEDRDPDPVVLKQGYDPKAKQPPGPILPVECEVRVRVKTDAGDQPAQKEDRRLTGRVFDTDGSPLAGVQVYYNKNRTFKEVATDRLGVFRLRGLPHGPLQLGLRRNFDQHGSARVPPEAVEVDLIFPHQTILSSPKENPGIGPGE